MAGAGARAWIAVLGAGFASFMSLLDITVTNASLPQIQGSIGASGTEGTWIGTAYIAAEIAMIPLTSWFTRMLGMRVFLVSAITMFIVFSIFCAMAQTLPMMIIGRVGQGIAGGALIPAGLTIIASVLTDEQKPAGIAFYATSSVIAPVIGPPIGGWLTENLSWHVIFFMNLPIGLGLIWMLWRGLDPGKIRKEEFFKADWVGIAGLVLWLAAMVVILEEGQRVNWFESAEIVRLTIVSLIGLAMVSWSQATRPNPVLKLKLLKRFDYAAGWLCCCVMGAGSFTAPYLVPTFLGNIAGYSAQQTGSVAAFAGITAFLFMPVFAAMLGRVDSRLMIAAGMIGFGLANLMDSRMTVETVGIAFLASQLMRGAAQMIANLPLSQSSTQGLQGDDIADGAALFTVGRNIGGAIGLALTGVMLDRRTTLHTDQLGEAVTANSALGQSRLDMMAQGLASGDPAHDRLQAMRLYGGEIHRQALTMAYDDVFWLLGVLMIAASPLVLLIPRLKRRGGPVEAGH